MKAIERIYKYIDYKGVKPTRFEKEIGLSNGYLSTQLKRNGSLGEDILNSIIENCLDINPEWLLTGNGEMLKTNNRYKIDKTLYTPKSTDSLSHHENTIPLYDQVPTADIMEIFSENPQSLPIDYISIPNLPKCDGAMHIRGDSMYPLLKSGDIVAYKIVHDYQNIIWGEMYIVYLSHKGEEYFFCKFLKKSDKEGYIDFISHNQHHQTVKFPAKSIKALAMVKASIRFNTLL